MFRPVLEIQPPGPACATPAPKRTDDTKNATACAQGADAAYELGPAATEVRVESARAQDPAEVQTGVATGEWLVEVTLADAAGWLALTEKYVGKQLAIVLDGVVQSAPV